MDYNKEGEDSINQQKREEEENQKNEKIKQEQPDEDIQHDGQLSNNSSYQSAPPLQQPSHIHRKKILLINEINSKRFQNIVDYASIDIHEIKNYELSIKPHEYYKENNIQRFQWNNEQSIENQLTNVMHWFNHNIPLPHGSPNKHLIYKDVHNHPNLLYTSEYVSFLPYSLNGTCSLIVCPNSQIKLFDKQIHMLIEVKKPFNQQHHHQTNLKNQIQISICQLLASSAHVKHNNPIVLLLTDLNDIWYYFWFSYNTDLESTYKESNESSPLFSSSSPFKKYNDNIKISFTNTTNRNEAKFIMNYIIYNVFNIKQTVYRWSYYKFDNSLKKLLNPLVLNSKYKKSSSSPSSFSIWNFIRKYLIPCI